MNPILVATAQVAVFLLVWSCQATVLLVLVWLFMKVRAAKTPALRHRIWLLGLTAVALLPLLTTLMQRFPRWQPLGLIMNYAIELPQVIPDAAPPPLTSTSNKSIISPPTSKELAYLPSSTRRSLRCG